VIALDLKFELKTNATLYISVKPEPENISKSDKYATLYYRIPSVPDTILPAM